MVGLSRTVRGGELVAYELIVIRERGDRLVYIAHPSGQPSAEVLSTTLSEEMVRSWAPACENYTLSGAGLPTHLQIDIDVTPEFEEYMTTAWPKALATLTRLCEDGKA